MTIEEFVEVPEWVFEIRRKTNPTLLEALKLNAFEPKTHANQVIAAAIANLGPEFVDVKLVGLKRSGKPKIPKFCADCGVKCESTREARIHCKGKGKA